MSYDDDLENDSTIPTFSQKENSLIVLSMQR